MFSEDINFVTSYAKDSIRNEINYNKNIRGLIDQTKILIKSLENENLSNDTKIKIDNILSLLKLI